MRIHAVSTDTGGCHFYRLRTPLTALRAAGHQTSWDTYADADVLNHADVLVGQFLNGPQDLAAWESIAAAPRRPLLVYETDDDLFTLHELFERAVPWGTPECNARVQRFIELSDLVTVTTPELAKVYEPYARRIAVLPNAVPDWLLDLPVAPPCDRYTIGWVCSHSHLLDARHWYPTLAQYMDRNEKALFHWVGPPTVVGFRQWQQKTTGWRTSVPEYLRSLPGQFDVGIAPLAPLTFNAGKSGIKAQEYGAVGVPVIASDWPQYRAVVKHGRTGLLARTAGQWKDYLSAMEDPGYRATLGAAARELESTRTISKVCTMWTDAYQEAIDDRTR